MEQKNKNNINPNQRHKLFYKQMTKPIYELLQDCLNEKDINTGGIYFNNYNYYDKKLRNWNSLSHNPAAIALLERNPTKINWNILSGNPSPVAIALLEANQDKINWRELSKNPAAISLIERNLDKIDWGFLLDNPAAFPLLQRNPDKIDWNYYFRNGGMNTFTIDETVALLQIPDPRRGDRTIRDYLERSPKCFNWNDPDLLKHPAVLSNLDVIDFSNLVGNPAGIPFIMEHCSEGKWSWFKQILLRENPNVMEYFNYYPAVNKLKKKDWNALSHNPAAISLLEANPEKIQWDNFCRNNTAGISLMEQHVDKINWEALSANGGKVADLFLKYPEKWENDRKIYIHWGLLSSNPHTIPLLEQYPEKISWINVIRSNTNPCIFSPVEEEEYVCK